MCVGACIFISMYTQIKLIYIRDTYIYIYKLCKGVVSLGLLQVILSGEGDVPLFVTQPVTAASGNALWALCHRDSFRGDDFCRGCSVAGCGCPCWRRLLGRALHL